MVFQGWMLCPVNNYFTLLILEDISSAFQMSQNRFILIQNMHIERIIAFMLIKFSMNHVFRNIYFFLLFQPYLVINSFICKTGCNGCQCFKNM